MSDRHRSRCPINLSVEVLGDRWTLLVLRDIVFAGKRHYRELLASEEGISTNILADRLRMLVDHGLLTRSDDPSHKQKAIYSLTEQSIELVPVLVQIGIWGRRHLPADEALSLRPTSSNAAAHPCGTHSWTTSAKPTSAPRRAATRRADRPSCRLSGKPTRTWPAADGRHRRQVSQARVPWSWLWRHSVHACHCTPRGAPAGPDGLADRVQHGVDGWSKHGAPHRHRRVVGSAGRAGCCGADLRRPRTANGPWSASLPATGRFC
ncbi:helix-turn-helix domain-containing protein [Saccharomonospora sp. CUA-673]|uniref:winged helix-turn-helix transcriptional regulator n=1 Tax=Saccharomonospora sp. CUA-673 TaxID=1904969 RepID=UPI002100FA2E|nr:helix-turn-helix domain-containing protein [Saccharomonospora sp. CUA-673]